MDLDDPEIKIRLSTKNYRALSIKLNALNM